mmetsp:Transcript_50573/g.109669  ORF Transcript_50573/g.109669 Transcript_50573/m.109669 type:complete len:242 (+) Transcript_50573:1012-1737(+)
MRALRPSPCMSDGTWIWHGADEMEHERLERHRDRILQLGAPLVDLDLSRDHRGAALVSRHFVGRVQKRREERLARAFAQRHVEDARYGEGGDDDGDDDTNDEDDVDRVVRRRRRRRRRGRRRRKRDLREQGRVAAAKRLRSRVVVAVVGDGDEVLAAGGHRLWKRTEHGTLVDKTGGDDDLLLDLRLDLAALEARLTKHRDFALELVRRGEVGANHRHEIARSCIDDGIRHRGHSAHAERR